MINVKDKLIKYTALIVLLACAFSYSGAADADGAGNSWLSKANAAVTSVINFVAEEQPHVK